MINKNILFIFTFFPRIEISTKRAIFSLIHFKVILYYIYTFAHRYPRSIYAHTKAVQYTIKKRRSATSFCFFFLHSYSELFTLFAFKKQENNNRLRLISKKLSPPNPFFSNFKAEFKCVFYMCAEYSSKRERECVVCLSIPTKHN